MYYRPVPYECFYSEIKCDEEKLIVIAATVFFLFFKLNLFIKILKNKGE